MHVEMVKIDIAWYFTYILYFGYLIHREKTVTFGQENASVLYVCSLWFALVEMNYMSF